MAWSPVRLQEGYATCTVPTLHADWAQGLRWELIGPVLYGVSPGPAGKHGCADFRSIITFVHRQRCATLAHAHSIVAEQCVEAPWAIIAQARMMDVALGKWPDRLWLNPRDYHALLCIRMGRLDLEEQAGRTSSLHCLAQDRD